MLFENLCTCYDEVYALEPNSESVRKIIYKNERIKKISINRAEDMEFDDNFFDTVFCRTSIHHFADIGKGLHQINRVLKKGGYLIASEPCRDNLLWRKIGLWYTHFSKRFESNHHLFTSEELHALIDLYGFEIEYMIRFGYLGFLIAGIPYRNLMIPSSATLGDALVALDKIFQKIPVIKEFSWHVIMKARKL